MPWIQIGKVARDLRENPWDWPRYGTPLARKTRLRLHGSPRNAISRGFDTVPKEITRLLVRKCVDYGIRYTRLSSPWNDAAEIEPQIRELERDGVECIANLIYSVSPRHTDEYYEERAASMAALRPYRICFKDVGGLLTPERAKVLIPKILRKTGDVDVEYHAHCNNGLATLCYLDAVDAGIRFLHTAIPPLADGSSNPSLFEVATNLTERGHTPMVDQTGLAKVSRHLTFVARRDGLPVGARPPHDERLLKHQVPGGMISNLRHQLDKVGQSSRMPEVLEETGRVRADFGYPIMVTPLSQFVGVQASMNVITGQRYSVVSDEVIQYALGLWGQEAPAGDGSRGARPDPGPAPEPRSCVGPSPRRSRWRRSARNSAPDCRMRSSSCGCTRLDDADKLERRGKPDGPLLGESPLVDLVSGLAAAKNYRQIVVRKGAAHVGVSRG